MNENLNHLVKKMKQSIQMPFVMRPFRKRLEEAIDIFAQTQTGKDLLQKLENVPKKIQVGYFSEDLGFYNASKKTLALNILLFRKSERENLVCTLGHELFHKMLRDRKISLYKRKMSPSQFITLEILDEVATTAFEETLMMEAFPQKAKRKLNMGEAFQLFEKTKKEYGLQTAHKKTQAFLIKSALTEQLFASNNFDWLGTYLCLSIISTKNAFVYDGDKISYEGNDKSYRHILDRYTQMYKPFLTANDLDKDIISTNEAAKRDVQELTDNIRRFKTERPKGILDTQQTRIQALRTKAFNQFDRY